MNILEKERFLTAHIVRQNGHIQALSIARGYDRFVYQHQCAGFRVHEIVSDVINHIDAFQEVNQYVWMTVGDLHGIADEMDLPIGVQKELSLECRSYEETGPTSAKQSYSDNKKMQFIRHAAYADRWLKVLFDYIEDNFKEDEVVVSLFADHGQGYLIPLNAHFLAKERANVAFMFRGGDAEGKGRVEEIVSACDYSAIMRTLADVKIPETPTDGRFQLGQYEYWLEDSARRKIEDPEMKQKYLDIVLKHIAPILIYE